MRDVKVTKNRFSFFVFRFSFFVPESQFTTEDTEGTEEARNLGIQN
jgi:hypothetical protein